MTRLDLAFIKAYSKINAAPMSQPALMSTTAEPPAGSSIAAPAPLIELADCGALRLDDAQVASPPHWALPATSSFTTWDTSAALAINHAEPESIVEPDPIMDRPTSQSPDQGRAAANVEPAPAGEPLPQGSPSIQLRIDTPTVAALPAESLSTEPPLSASLPVIATEPARPQSWRAAFEVDNLLWPEVNYSLAAACRGQWEQWMKECIEASREGQKVLLVSSHRRGEGRTSLVLCLAQLLSQKQQRVAVVDADFQRPQIARQLKLLPSCGWDEVVRDSQPLTEAWIESVSDGVTLLPLGQHADAAGLTGNPRLKQTFEALRSQHDIVLVDAGAISDLNDRETLALLAGTAQIDSAVLVRDVRSTSWDTLHDSQKCLDAIGIGRCDVVENFAD